MIDQIILLLTGGLIVAIFEYYFIVKPKVAELRKEIAAYKRSNEILDKTLDKKDELIKRFADFVVDVRLYADVQTDPKGSKAWKFLSEMTEPFRGLR